VSTQNEEIGRGVGSRWEVVKLKEGMNVAELREQLNKLPNSGVLQEVLCQSSSEGGFRFVVIIRLSFGSGYKL